MAFEQRLLSAETDQIRLEEQQYRRLLALVLDFRADLTVLSQSVAKLDVLSAFAEKARHNGWLRPEIVEGRELVMNGEGEDLADYDESGELVGGIVSRFVVYSEEADAFGLECGATVEVFQDSQGFVIGTVME